MIFETDEDFLEHYGVKGMKWGVRKETPTGGKGNRKKVSHSPNKEAYLNAIKKQKTPSKEQQIKNLKASHLKAQEKLGKDPKESDSKSFPTRNQILTIGVGAAFVGGVVLYAKYGDVLTTAKAGETLSSLKYNILTAQSQSSIWGKGSYVTKRSFDIPPKEFPKGHEFFRISMNSESTFEPATYAVPSIDDFNRYVNSFSKEKGVDISKIALLTKGNADEIGLHKITFKSKMPIKTPDLETRLDVVRKVMLLGDDREEAIRQYNDWAGGSWDSPKAKEFIKILKKRGYDAMVDDMDVGIIGEHPMVIFSPEKFTAKVSEPIRTIDVKAAKSNLREISNRRPPP